MAELALTAAIAFFVTIDPIGVSAIFAGLTVGSRAHARRMAARGTAVAAAVLLAFALVGEALMAALGVGLPALRVAGGILLLLLAIDMVFARPSGMRAITPLETEEAGQRDDISVFPLAVPLIAGPGAITVAILFMGRADTLPGQAVVIGVMLVMLAATYLALRFAAGVTHLLGVTGMNVLNRVLGIVLAALACQYVLDGLTASGLAG
jgi:multiple antibiotic resistance protein